MEAEVKRYKVRDNRGKIIAVVEGGRLPIGHRIAARISGASEDDILGAYNQQSKRIWIQGGLTDERRAYVLRHEIAHAYDLHAYALPWHFLNSFIVFLVAFPTWIAMTILGVSGLFRILFLLGSLGVSTYRLYSSRNDSRREKQARMLAPTITFEVLP